MTYNELVKVSKLPPQEVILLAAFVLKRTKEEILTHPEMNIRQPRAKRLKQLFKDRRAGWSIAVLTGTKGFYGLDLNVDKNVLVPRPETEVLVEEMIKVAEQDDRDDPLFIDIGTGSGAIILALASEISRKKTPISPEYVGTDISAAALRLARKNSKALGLNDIIQFKKGDLALPALKQIPGRSAYIAANLPYLTSEEIKKAPSIQKEPRLALHGGNDGLEPYRKLFAQLKNISASLHIFCELSPWQIPLTRRLAKTTWPGCSIRVIKDLSRRNRFILIRVI